MPQVVKVQQTYAPQWITAFFALEKTCANDVQCTNIARQIKKVNVMKSGNLTVRVELDLKHKAQVAARALDVSLSQVVADALRGIIRASQVHKSWVGDFLVNAPKRQIQEHAEDLGLLAGKKRVLARIKVLQEKERKNELNKETRKELAQLLKANISWG